jgi:type IV secretion system protein VirB1
MEMMACQNLAVPAEVMQHVVNVESSRNPFAIGVVGGQLVRQPQNLGEAVATVNMLEQKGYNYSLGVAQVNRANLGKYGLNSYAKAFEVCPNLVAGSQILAQCYASAGGDWGKAFSCYYSGDFTTGYQDGYVQKILDSMARQSAATGANAIPIQLVDTSGVPSRTVNTNIATSTPVDSSAYRVAMRRVADVAASTLLAPAVASAAGVGMQPSPLLPAGVSVVSQQTGPQLGAGVNAPPGPIATDPTTAALMAQVGAQLPAAPQQPGRIATDPETAAAMAQVGISAGASAAGPAASPASDIFVPQVQGPNDPAPTAAAPAATAPQGPRVDQADLRLGGSDGAFVF